MNIIILNLNEYHYICQNLKHLYGYLQLTDDRKESYSRNWIPEQIFRGRKS